MIPDPQFVSFLPGKIEDSETVTWVYTNNAILSKPSKEKAMCETPQ